MSEIPLCGNSSPKIDSHFLIEFGQYGVRADCAVAPPNNFLHIVVCSVSIKAGNDDPQRLKYSQMCWWLKILL